ncbi:B12-binding domain-containing radical SAM protein [Desulfovibrio inopinatus]|uniref:B12-binding domain-containing radical SAM protein n=1 Tax=Desulfovibrio inopinatus TaxID=102109 RepID=UPI00040C3470|nr:radical SAM protein [Desulfovibrio inopinatus]
MNVLLVAPPIDMDSAKLSPCALPIGLLQLAAVLREAGHVPTLLDLATVKIPEGIEPEDYRRALLCASIRELDPGYVGINCLTSMNFPQVRRLIYDIHVEAPDIPICLGGIHPTWYYREIFEHCPEVDYIVLGEGETQTVALANAIASGDRYALQGVQSLAYRNADGALVVHPRTSYIDDLDALPLPAYDLLDFTDYHRDLSRWYNPKNHTIKTLTPLFTSRSCPFNCSFCMGHIMTGRGYREKSPDKVVDEIEILTREFGQNYFAILDENSILNKDRFIAICNDISKRGLDIQLSAVSGFYLNAVDEDIVKAYKKAGGISVSIPIESGSSYIRNTVINKNLSDETIINAVRLFKKYDLFTIGFFIMGFEEDTPSTLDESIAMMERLQLDINNTANLSPYPGTKIFARAKQNGTLLIDDNQTWNGEVLFAQRSEMRFFIKPPGLSMDELRRYRAVFNQYFLYSDRVRHEARGSR